MQGRKCCALSSCSADSQRKHWQDKPPGPTRAGWTPPSRKCSSKPKWCCDFHLLLSEFKLEGASKAQPPAAAINNNTDFVQ
jgi:hypothetical protein